MSERMDSSQPGPVHLRGTSAVSLHERFSQLQQNQLTPDPSHRKRRSVWTRLGWQAVRRRGFWSFMNKYRWRARCCSSCRERGNLSHLLAQRRLLRTTDVQRATAGRRQKSLQLQRGGATSLRGCGFSRDHILTKKQLEAQLDKYMSLSKSRLDKELDDYMSMSRSRLDAQLDDYMSLAGQSRSHWDGDAEDRDADNSETEDGDAEDEYMEDTDADDRDIEGGDAEDGDETGFRLLQNDHVDRRDVLRVTPDTRP